MYTKVKAMNLATHYHSGQYYGNMPYTQHLFEVEEECRCLFSSGFRTQDQYDVCWLHDVVEDTECTLDDLHKEGFNECVISCVSILTKKDGQTREEYLTNIVGFKMTYPLAWQVKVADAMCNLEHSIKGGDDNRVRRYTRTLSFLYGGNA